jgi:hypothetical protein
MHLRCHLAIENSIMHKMKTKKVLLTVICIAVVATLFIFSTHEQAVDFNTEVKPIINKKCISCHGGVKRQGDFSLLFRSEALAKTKSGKLGIVPGDPDHSEMIRRLTLKDPEERMPYKHEPLTEAEINTLTRWVKQGAKWGDHWAYVPVKPVEVPKPKGSLLGLLPGSDGGWARNDIDHFIYRQLQEQQLKPSGEADKPTLLRRVSLDLIGMPAPDSIANTYLNSKDDGAYEKLVNALLASPRFGERWAAMWMDVARYADSQGYEKDIGRNVWRYRDWLIRAFNDNKPYDEFLIEQLAGDLLPGATDEQLIATVFQRNTMTNSEGGTDNEEFRTAAVIDRVNSTWEGVLGTTFACVQCHSHPYDPFKHDEYYKFMAFFNDTRDEDTFADYPLLRHYSPEDSTRLDEVVNWLKSNGYTQQASSVRRFLKTWQPVINSIAADQFVNSELYDTKWLGFRNNAVARLKQVNLDSVDQLIFRSVEYTSGGEWTAHLDKPDGPVLTSVHPEKTKGWTIKSKEFPRTSGVHDIYLTYSNPGLKDADATGLLFEWFYFAKSLPGKDKPGYDNISKTYWELLTKEVPGTPIMMDNPKDMHRTTNVFERGNWLVKGKEVQPDVPHTLNPMPKGAPRNRLGLAKWMVSADNPLTARTMVNRLWEQVFGTGLAETLEDLGTQGAEPSHRQLLDYLSYRFMHQYRWNVKQLLKDMVMSATYRQTSVVTKEQLQKDLFNKYYARGPRVRLTAEQVRDQALSVAGLISEKMYGPGVMPWQPNGIWMSPYSGEKWLTSQGEDQYRRAVYTYWKRTAPYPSMITFDGASREVCSPRRIRTNTPLQALVTLNDSVYLDAARHFAYRMQQISKGDVQQQISKGYELAMLKGIAPAKLEALTTLYNTAYGQFRKDTLRTREMAGSDTTHNNPETAALVVVANAMLNLDELVTKN